MHFGVSKYFETLFFLSRKTIFVRMRKTIKIFYKSLASLSFDKLLKLSKLTISHPLFTILGFWATVKAYKIAQVKYPKTASSNGIGNAFRHALWTSLILSYCCKISSPTKAKEYCLKMTNMHEELFPNEALEKQMDLHNNQIGIQLFFEMLPGVHRQFFETSFLVNELEGKTKSAILIQSENQFPQNELVYLE